MSSMNALSRTHLLVMQQVTGFLSNDFTLEDSEGQAVAYGHTRGSAASRMFRGHREFEIQDVDGTELQLDGSLSGFRFRLMAGEAAVATVDRQWAGLGQAFMGRSRYGVSLDPNMPEIVRYAVIGSVIALDLIRDKAQRRR